MSVNKEHLNPLFINSMNTEEAYFGYYGQLQHQQNMLEDTVRTLAYQQAVFESRAAFDGKVVLDVGAGSGILSFFAAQAGARKVYAVEASAVARNARKLVEANGFENIIEVIEGKIEELALPEPVDIIISEPMGVFLLHERMIESFMLARDKFAKPQALMFPSVGEMFLAPFTDGLTFADLKSRSKFWQSQEFYGLDLSVMEKTAEIQIFSQPVVGGFDPNSLLTSKHAIHKISFQSDAIDSLLSFEIPFEFCPEYTGVMHGFAGWFAVGFPGGLVLSTAPSEIRTHWQQVRFFLQKPIAVNKQHTIISGTLSMQVNQQRSYTVTICGKIFHDETLLMEFKEHFRLQDQQYLNLSSVAYTATESREYLNLF